MTIRYRIVGCKNVCNHTDAYGFGDFDELDNLSGGIRHDSDGIRSCFHGGTRDYDASARRAVAKAGAGGGRCGLARCDRYFDLSGWGVVLARMARQSSVALDGLCHSDWVCRAVCLVRGNPDAQPETDAAMGDFSGRTGPYDLGRGLTHAPT